MKEIEKTFLKPLTRVLVLAPHTDDGEFGCGGTIARLTAEGSEVFYAAFSIAEESVPPPFPKDILITEVANATHELGIKREALHIYRYPVRKLPEHRQAILEDLVALGKKIMPDLVLLPTISDIHQDHTVIATEGTRAFKRTSILGYELPWNTLEFSTECFVHLNEDHIKAKLRSLDKYDSQKGRNYASEDFIRGLARVRGTQIGTRYAEAFDIVRWVLP